ncbi:MAG: type II toxin-antitoxin system RelE/ParE family toxin [Desulfococcaceae bacterium]|jgi:plasmid stabilization system protein ParE|nr:type II toxin-antitoxin system RelE/ParE family toxin [Desulfococcaceae bacterium]
MKYIFHPDALREYSEATAHYKKISPKLGKAFVDEVEISISKIVSTPKTWMIIADDIRRYLLHRFPYGIYYTIEKDYILIVAVMHLSRKPGYWKNRI